MFDCPYHVHPEVEVLLIEGSRGRFLVGDHAGRYGPGDCFLFGPGLPHMFCSDEPEPEPPQVARSRYAQFREDCLGPQFFRLPELHPVARLLQHAARGLYYRLPPEGGPVEESFNFLFAQEGGLRVSALVRLLYEFARAAPLCPLASEGYESRPSTRSSERLERALTHINRHLASGVNLPGTAHAAAMSPEAFSRFFHRHLGKTFQDYVTDLRVAEACRLLLDTDLTVAEICFKAGFNNIANFNRHFLRRKRMSPREYRALGQPS